MKIAVTYENGQIFQHFGHTEEFKIYETKDQEILSAKVLSTGGQGHGALAGFLQEHQVDVLICGGIGGGAQNALTAAGIKLYGGCTGDADQAVDHLLHNMLMYNPNVKCDHHDHEEGHDCGGSCHHGDCNAEPERQEDQMITLTVTDDNGKSEDRDFRLIAIYSVKNQQYIALTPDLDVPELEADIYLYRYAEENGQCTVEEIMEDEEFAVAADGFQSWQLSRE